MAIALQGANLVWQKVTTALIGASPAAQLAFKQLKMVLATQGKNPQLQIVQFDSVTNGSDGGNATAVIADAACRVIAIYGKKSTGATVGYTKITDHATTLGVPDSFLVPATNAGEEFYAIAAFNTALNIGHSMASGAVVGTVTAYNGTTKSLKVDSVDGFVIIGTP